MTDNSETQSLLHAIIEGTSDVVYVQDLENRYLVINPVGAKMLGKTVDEVVGKRDVDLFAPHEAKIMADENATVVETSETLMQEITVHLGGRDHTFQTNKSPFRNESGTCVGVIGVCRDITEVKLAEELVRRNERLVSIGTLTAGIAHSLNNALSPVVGMADMLLTQHQLSNEIRKAVSAILDGASDATDTVRRLQRFTSLKSDDDPPELVDINDLVPQVVESTRPIWSEGSCHVETELNEGVYVMINPAELRQALINLIHNASEAMPEGGLLTIRTGHKRHFSFVEVSDTGLGMTEEQLARCAEPFYTTKDNGNGLGLSICYGLAKRHDGSLTASSELGKGSRFEICFPKASPESTGEIVTDEKGQNPEENSLRVLYIDDDTNTRNAVGSMLRASGRSVLEADSVAEGLSKFDPGKFDVVLTDVGMAGMYGYNVVEKVRELDPTLPILFITGWSKADVENRIGRGRPKPDGILEKPVTIRALNEALTLVMKRRDASE